MVQKDERSTFLMLIAAYKLFKALLLILVGIGALRLVHRDVQAIVGDWIEMLRLNPDGRFVHVLMLRLPGLTDQKLVLIAAGMFLYSTIFIVQGVGLALRRRWAEYMTVILTSLLLPLEVYELIKKPTVVRAAVLFLNIAIVLYLIHRLRRAAR